MKLNIGLWKTTSEKGTEYYKGTKSGVEINGINFRVSVFINGNKKNEKSPDLNVVLTEIKEDTLGELPKNTTTQYQSGEIEISDNELPF